MAKIFITGSTDGLGQMAAALLVQQRHDVILHARNAARGKEALKRTPGATGILTGDLASISETKDLAFQLKELGPFDAIIHNAGVYEAPGNQILHVNTLAPYMMTCLVPKPKRLIYLSSGLHAGGRLNVEGIKKGSITYSDSKLHVVMLALAMTRKWPHVYSNSVNPGWVPTKMGGRRAPDDLQKGCETQAWLAVSEDAEAKVSGRYFFHQTERPCSHLADDIAAQDRLMTALEEVTGVKL